MKKISLVLILFSFSLLVGCTLGNTPTSRVEAKLSDYQMLKDNVGISYTDLTTDTTLSQEIKEGYEKAIKNQYRNMSYEIKEEVIDGDTATVTVEIEVMNYKYIIDRIDASSYEATRYHELILDGLDTTKDMVIYTVDFSLTKGEDDNWSVDELSSEIREKLLGIY